MLKKLLTTMALLEQQPQHWAPRALAAQGQEGEMQQTEKWALHRPHLSHCCCQAFRDPTKQLH